MRHIVAGGALLLLTGTAPALAQGPAPSVAFPQVTGDPIPLQSASGRFSSLNPLDQLDCSPSQVGGRVVSPRLIMVKDISCGREGHENVLVNVELGNPADAAQMVPGRHVVIAGQFQNAEEEDRDPGFVVQFLVARQARLVSADPLDRSAPAAPAFTSYMKCQPPELDTLARKLGRELCVQNTLVTNGAGQGLEAAARTPARLAPEDAVAGAPEAISCRLDPKLSDHNLSAIACARNSYWAWYRAKWDDPLSSTPAPP